jgi:DNA-binding transcriptional LysR family regulator
VISVDAKIGGNQTLQNRNNINILFPIMRLPDLEAWAIFASVADHGSFSAAANAMSLSKATVSKAVARLEAHIGAPLFARTSRRVALTAAGERLAVSARRIVAEAHAAEEDARDEAEAPRGLIRLAAPLSFGVSVVAPVIATFLADYPGITIDLALSDERVDIVAGGFDLALRIGVLGDSSLRARKIRDVMTHVIAAPAYLAHHGEPTHPRDLESHRVICYSLLATPDSWRFSRGSEDVVVRPTGSLRVNNGDAMLPALRAGVGIAFLPDFIVAADLEAKRLTAVLNEWQLPPLALHLISLPSRFRAKRVELLADKLVSQLALTR